MCANWVEPGLDAPARHDGLDVVSCAVAGWRIGFEAWRVQGARSAQVSPTQATATATRLGLPGPTQPPRAPQWLRLHHAGQMHELLVDGPVELLRLPVAAIHPLPALLAASTRVQGLRALGFTPTGEMLLLIDLAILLSKKYS